MKTKHTPGPWEIKVHDKGPYFSEVEIWHENYGLLAHMPDNSSIWNSEKKEAVALEALNKNIANATLMAAAPELLEALEAVYALIEEGAIVRDISKDFNSSHFIKQGLEITHALILTNEAIKKATE